MYRDLKVIQQDCNASSTRNATSFLVPAHFTIHLRLLSLFSHSIPYRIRSRIPSCSHPQFHLDSSLNSKCSSLAMLHWADSIQDKRDSSTLTKSIIPLQRHQDPPCCHEISSQPDSRIRGEAILNTSRHAVTTLHGGRYGCLVVG